MIHLVIGTKAQLVKMAPIMVELQSRSIRYNFIFTGQHQETIDELLNVFGLPKPDYVMYSGKDITKVPQMIFWIARSLIHTVVNRKKIFKNSKGIALVHGDAFSALLGAFMAKVSGVKVGFVEAGLRSFNLFHPFPEEITRIIVSWLADYHFCPSDFAYDNSLKYRGIKINTKANTLYDTLMMAIKNNDKVDIAIPAAPYCVVSIHRFENIFIKSQFELIIQAINEIAQRVKVIFILHLPTKERLIELGLYQDLETNPNIEFRPRYDYFQFIKLVSNAEFLVTDGGSNQEENSYMGKPCLLMRKATERKEGLGSNTVISKYDMDIIRNFVANYRDYRREPLVLDESPSKIIVDAIGGHQ